MLIKPSVSSPFNLRSGPAQPLKQKAASAPDKGRKTQRWILLTIIAIGVFYLSTIRRGHEWGDDFSMYINHARNLVEGVDYSFTGFTHNPSRLISPRSYPPVFPLMLALVYQLWGMNLTAMKVEVILCFLLALYIIYLGFRDDLPQHYLIALIIIIGFNPTFWVFKDNILSDLPFLLFTYLSLWLIHNAYKTYCHPNKLDKTRLLYVLLISLAIYLAYGTRITGLVLVACLLGHDLIKHHRPSLFAIVTVVLTVGLVYLQRAVMQNDVAAGYAEHLHGGESWATRLLTDLIHAKTLLQFLSEYWANGYSKIFRLFLLAILSGLAIVGYLAKLRRWKVSCFELFLPLYLAPHILLPIVMDPRYLLPVLPLYVYYAFQGLQTIGGDFAQLSGKLAFSGLLLAVMASYTAQYTVLNFGAMNEGIGTVGAQQLFAYVRKETSESDILIFSKPRALSLFTSRHAAIWNSTVDDRRQWDFLRQIKASYLIVGPAHVELINEQLDQQMIQQFVERNHAWLQETYSNIDFRVYRIKESL